jgi:NADH-ubiquinone oxidoreductase chain 5
MKPFPDGFSFDSISFRKYFVGYLGKDMMIGLGTNFWGNSLLCYQNLILLESEYIPQTQNGCH